MEQITLNIPVAAEHLNLDDRKKVFAWFITKMIGKHGKRTAFYMYSVDFRKITKLWNDPHLTDNIDDLRTFLRIASINEHTIRFQWKENPEYQSLKGVVLQTETTITDRNALNVYFYLLGRMQDTGLVEERDEDSGLYTYETKKRTKNLRVHYYKQIG